MNFGRVIQHLIGDVGEKFAINIDLWAVGGRWGLFKDMIGFGGRCGFIQGYN